MRKACVFILIVVGIQGCATFDGAFLRQTDAEAFLAKTTARTDAVLAEGDAFTLSRCIIVAQENNLNVKTADLEKRLARLNRRIAFSNFLPEVTLQ